MLLDQALLDKVSAEAKASPRLRMNFNLHESLDSKVQRLFNAMEPGTIVPIQRHQNTAETMLLVRGKMNVYRPAVTQQGYLAFESRSVLDRLYGSSVKRFVAALYQDKKVDDKQLGELEEFLEELKRRG